MASKNQSKLAIERTICFAIAAIGALLLWASVAQAAESAAPSFQGVLTSAVTATVIPKPGTLVMLTCGIICVTFKLRRGGV